MCSMCVRVFHACLNHMHMYNDSMISLCLSGGSGVIVWVKITLLVWHQYRIYYQLLMQLIIHVHYSPPSLLFCYSSFLLVCLFR